MLLIRPSLKTLLRSLIGVLLAASGSMALAQDTPAQPNPYCENLAPDLARAAKEWQRPAQDGKVLDHPEGDADLPAGVKIKITLYPSEKVTLAMAPRNPEVNVAGYSGLVSFHTGKAGPYRVLMTQYIWLEMIDASGKTAAITVRAGALDSNKQLNRCAGMGKNLSFDLAADTRYWLQLSGAQMRPVELAISAPD